MDVPGVMLLVVALVGRTLELEQLSRAIADASLGRGRLVLLAGEPGLGKSRLAEEAARRSGLRVIWGRCWEEGGAPAYWPWIQILRALRRDHPTLAVPPEIARLLPELGDSTSLRQPIAEERFLLFDAIQRFLSAAAAPAPLLFVIDDVHAADVASLQLLAFVASHLVGTPIALIGTFRTTEARVTPEVGALIDRLGREAETIVPRRLAREDIAAMAAESGMTDPAVIAEIDRTSEGNPLFARELVKLSERGGAIAIPETVRAAIREHLRRLPRDVRELADHAAVLGREVSASLLARFIGRDDVSTGLAALLEHGVLAALAPGRIEFAHGLFVETLHHDLAAAKREAMHARAAELLRGTASDAELSRHLFDAGPAHASAAIAAARHAADVASRQFAFDEAVQALARAATMVPAGDTELAYELAIALGTAQIHAGEIAAGKATCVRAVDLARGLGDVHRLTRAVSTYGLALNLGATDRVLVALVDEALAALPPGDSPERARLTARLAAALQPAADSSGPIALAREAIEMVRRIGEPRAVLDVVYGAMPALLNFGPSAERLALDREVLELATRFGEQGMIQRTHYRLIIDCLDSGDIAGAAAHQRAFDELVRDLRQPHHHWTAAQLRALFALHRGQLAAHRAEVADATRLADNAERLTMMTGTPVFWIKVFELVTLIALGDRAGIAADSATYISTFRGAHPMYEAIAVPYVQMCAGDIEQARAGLARLTIAQVLAFRDMQNCAWVAEVIVAVGEREMAAELYAGMHRDRARWCCSGIPGLSIETPVTRVLGLLAAFLGRNAEARQHFAITFDKLRAAGLPVLLARTLVEWAACGVATHDEAVAALAEARTLSTELGLPLGPRIEAAARALVVAPPATGVEFVREGDTWRIALGTSTCRIKHTRGIELIAQLVADPTRELHVLDLVGADGTDTGDAGDVLDREAIAAYRARAAELREELDEAEAFNDPGRRSRAAAELEAIHEQLSGGTKLGNKPRRAAGAAEKARVNVQRRITDAIKRIAELAPVIGRHLDATIRTGTQCSYDPRRA